MVPALGAFGLRLREALLDPFDQKEQCDGQRASFDEGWFLSGRIQEPAQKSYREFLGEHYFATLDVMKGLGQPDRVRVVFCFGD